jgi:uncharacterized protein
MTVDDPKQGPVELQGWLHKPEGAKDLAILVHGLGGNADSPYVVSATAEAASLGMASLRFHQRGADGRGQDLYHAGLYQDLCRALDHPEVAKFQRIVMLGFSLGGHTSLKAAVHPHPRLDAVGALCPPILLGGAARGFDRTHNLVYRQYILRSLKAMHRPLVEQGRAWAPWSEVARIRRIVDWDEQVVAPRHGYTSAQAYYEGESVGPVLHQAQCPTLVVRTAHDPLVQDGWQPDTDLDPGLVTYRLLRRGGHLGFRHSPELPGHGSVVLKMLQWLQTPGARRTQPARLMGP